MKHRFAFAGFRHPHIFALLDLVGGHPDCQVVAAYEGDALTRRELETTGRVNITHENYAGMLEESGCSVVAIGDVYANRGALAIAALEAGLHVISDKPITTKLAELEEIERLSRQHGLSVGCQLDLVENKAMRQMRSAILGGAIGEICTVNVAAQHPLRLATRAKWYFEPNQHGGTINDIGIHVFDLIPWLTGMGWQEITFAREWNAKASDYPHFKDCAQFYGILSNRATCFADLSYLAPDTMGYELPNYWRIVIHGTRGMVEASCGAPQATVVTDADQNIYGAQGPSDSPATCLDDFVAEIEGRSRADGLTTERILSVSRFALEAQKLALISEIDTRS